MKKSILSSITQQNEKMKMNSGYIKLPHKCPKYPEIANTHQEVEQKFGYRNMGDGKVRAQSQCKKCR